MTKKNKRERLGKMTISLLHIVVPTVLALVVLIIYMSICKKKILEEISQLKAQLEILDNVPGAAVVA